ncbi:MAG: Hsp20/alpha crystallin family protein [Bacteroidota bacterium]
MFVHVSQMSPLFDLDRTSNELFSDPSQQILHGTDHPAVDIAEREHAFDLVVELPGMKREDIKISIEKGVLSVSGERKHYGFPEGTKVLLHETNTRPFERVFQLPDVVDVNGISAEMKDGILRIQLPKAERARPREIKVQ